MYKAMENAVLSNTSCVRRLRAQRCEYTQRLLPAITANVSYNAWYIEGLHNGTLPSMPTAA